MFSVCAGSPDKLGAHVTEQGVNFCIYGRLAKSVELVFFDDSNALTPSHTFQLSDVENRTAYYWHILVKGAKPGQLYGFRVDGPYRDLTGTHFFPEKVLLDPYALLVDRGENFSREAALGKGSNVDKCLKSVVVDIDDYDWEEDSHPRHSFSKTVIYELHVGGFTRHSTSALTEEKRGTYAGIVEKIPYLQELGITAIELMPVYQFDPSEHHAGLVNYWGYSPISFFSVHREYSSDQSIFGPLNEFRDMVKALHQAGIEVILDVVYNHTAEGDENGPTYSFRGFDSRGYYMLSENGQHYMNYSGCGNTFNGTHSIARRMIIDSLHFWVEKMHVDGFRFDLASILSRDEWGHPMPSPPTLWSIDTDPILSPIKLIAEAWDAGGLYQVGSLAGQRWREWNGHFRDDVRRFVKGDSGMMRKFVDRLIGSPDIYGDRTLEPAKSVNFITCHDGFTLADLVSYNHKHNLANGENNRDGGDHNHSWNHGVEGETSDPEILHLRNQQMKNLMTINLISLGTPMVLMGDEIAQTQNGNNNSYCQDNPGFWFNWDDIEKNHELFRFTKSLISQRSMLEIVSFDDVGRRSLHDIIDNAGIRWHGIKLNEPNWGENSRAIALESQHLSSGSVSYVIFNAYWEPLSFELPIPPNGKWMRAVDTSLTGTKDIYVEGDKKYWINTKEYLAASRSVVILIG